MASIGLIPAAVLPRCKLQVVSCLCRGPGQANGKCLQSVHSVNYRYYYFHIKLLANFSFNVEWQRRLMIKWKAKQPNWRDLSIGERGSVIYKPKVRIKRYWLLPSQHVSLRQRWTFPDGDRSTTLSPLTNAEYASKFENFKLNCRKELVRVYLDNLYFFIAIFKVH